MSGSSILNDTVEATAFGLPVSEWHLVLEERPPLRVSHLRAILRSLLGASEGASVTSLEFYARRGAEFAHVNLAGDSVLDKIDCAPDASEIAKGAKARVALRLWCPDDGPSLVMRPVCPAGSLFVAAGRDHLRVKVRLTVNLYTDVIRLYEKREDDFLSREIEFSEGAAKNRALIAEALARLQRELGAEIESWDTKVLEPGGVDASGIRADARVRPDNRKKLRKVGAFRELRLGIGAKSLREAARAPSFPDKARVLEYLRSGALMVFVPELVRDVFDESVSVGAPNLRTDGDYVWSELLPYYVEHYDIALPQDFLEHAARNGWRVPTPIDTTSLTI